MSSAGARPLPKAGPGQRRTQMICSGRTPLASHSALLEARRVVHGRTGCNGRALRLPHAVPAQPGDPSRSAGAASGPIGVSADTAETNGVPAVSTAYRQSVDSGAHSTSSASSDAGLGSSFPVEHSARANFRSVLKRTYLGEMLFVVVGSAVCAALSYWTVGTPLRRFNPYSFYVMLPEATGVQLGTPLRMKGVPMGSVLSATPMLDRVKVEVEVNEAKTIIPHNAKFELTQSGLIPSAAIDIITPEGVSADALASIVAARDSGSETTAERDGSVAPPATATAGTSSRAKRPAKAVRLASPKDVQACKLQGVLVCQGDQLDGIQGGSMDELMAHMLKTFRKGEEEVEGRGIVPGRGPLQG